MLELLSFGSKMFTFVTKLNPFFFTHLNKSAKIVRARSVEVFSNVLFIDAKIIWKKLQESMKQSKVKRTGKVLEDWHLEYFNFSL